jgi:hypothetical protein
MLGDSMPRLANKVAVIYASLLSRYGIGRRFALRRCARLGDSSDRGPADGVLCERTIGGYDRKIAHTRLRDQQPIEWIEMMQR